jgi:hypothetical protein
VDSEITKAKIKEQVDFLKGSSLAKEYGWIITQENIDVLAQLNPVKVPAKKFMVRLRCDDYPQKAPSVIFVNPDTKKEGLEFWPHGNAFKTTANPPGICIRGTREFHEHYHKGDPWDPKKFTFAVVLQFIQREINKSYKGD